MCQENPAEFGGHEQMTTRSREGERAAATTRSARHNASPRVSIGLPVYNGQRYIRQAVESVLRQTYPDFELLISDNASTDGTEAICREYAEQDERVRYERLERNLGSVRNFNRVFEGSTGVYFRWAAADDYVAPNHLEKCVEVLDNRPDVVLCHTKSLVIDAEGRTTGEVEPLNVLDDSAYQRFCNLWENLGLCNASYGLMRASVLRQTALEGNYLGSDRIVLAEMALRGKIVELPDPLFFRRLHPEAASSVQNMDELMKIYDPANGRHDRMYYSRLCRGAASAVRRAPVGFKERCSLYVYLGRYVFNKRDWFAREVAAFVTK